MISNLVFSNIQDCLLAQEEIDYHIQFLGPILQKEVADKISTICIIPQTTAGNTIPKDKPNIRNIASLPNRLQIQSQFYADCIASAPKHSITGYQPNGEATQPPIAFATPLAENTVANQNISPKRSTDKLKKFTDELPGRELLPPAKRSKLCTKTKNIK